MSKPFRLTAVAAFFASAFVSQTLLASAPPTFAPPLVVSNAAPAANMVMGDFDGDGIPDVALLSVHTDTNGQPDGATVTVRFGDGTNGFRSQPGVITLNLPGSSYTGFAAADLSGLGQSQLIIAGNTNLVIFNWSSGNFLLTQTIDLSAVNFYGSPLNAGFVTVGDLTAHGSRDILVSDVNTFNSGNHGVVWVTNDGKGDFGEPQAFGTYGTAARPVLADVNGDGLLDVVMTFPDSTTEYYNGTTFVAGGGTVGVLTNNGDGTLSSELIWGNQSLYSMTNSLGYHESLNTVAVAVADVDGDGIPDLISACFNPTGSFTFNYYLSVNLGNGDGTFQDGKSFAVSNGIVAMDAGDLNGDGRIDIATIDYSLLDQINPGFTVTEFTGVGASLAVARQEDFAGTGPSYTGIALGYTSNGTFVTFNNDSKIDVLLASGQKVIGTSNSVSGQFLVYKNTTGTTLPPTSVQLFGSVKPGAPLFFVAYQAATEPGLIVRIQSTTNTNTDGSWTDLADGNGGHLQLGVPGIYSFGTTGTTFYPAGAAVYFRAITSASGFTDSISTNILGPYSLKQGALAIGVKLTSTSDPTGKLQIAHIGDTLTYTFSWTNTGTASNFDLQVETPVPTYIDATSDLQFQFASNYLTFNQYGTYYPESVPGALDAKVIWKVSNLPPGYFQSVTLAVRIGAAVQVPQSIGLLKNYQVSSTNNQPPTPATGFSSGAPNVGTSILGPLQLTVTPDVTTVAPGGYINYTLKIQNLGGYTASNVVIADPAPEFTRFVPYSGTARIGTAFVNAKGVPIASPVFSVKISNKPVAVNNPLRLIGLYPTTSLPAAVQSFLSKNPEIVAPSDFADQAVFYVGTLAKGASATVRFTVQVQYINPVDIADQEIKNFDYLAYFSDPAGDIVESRNESGLIFTPVQGAGKNAPNLSLGKLPSATTVTPGARFFVGLVAHNGGASAAEDVFIQDRLPQGVGTVNPELMTVGSSPQVVTSSSSQADLNEAISFIGGSASITESKANYFVTLTPDGTLTVHGLHLEPNATVAIAYLMSVPASTPVPETIIAGTSFIGSGNGNQTPVGHGAGQYFATVPVGFPPEIPIQIVGDVQLFTPAQPFEAVPSPMVSTDPSATAAQLDALYKKNANASVIVPKSNPPAPISGVQLYFMHYQNTGTNAASDVHLLFSTPANTEFYRASFMGANGNLAIPAKGQSVTEPAKLGSGAVIFNLGTLKSGGGGYVMTEVIILPTAVNTNSSRLVVSAPEIYQGAQPVKADIKTEGTTKDSGGTIVYDGQNVPQIGIVKIVPQFVQQGSNFGIQFAVFNYGDVDVDEGAEVSFQAPAGTQIVGLTAPPGAVLSSNANSLDLQILFVKHYAGGFTVQLQATGAAGTAIAENAIVANVAYCGSFTPAPTTIQIVGAQQVIANTTITTVSGAQFVALGEMVVIPLGQYQPEVGTALVCGPSDLFGNLQLAPALSDSGNGSLIVAGRAEDIPLLNLPVLANTDAGSALKQLSAIVGKHGGNIFNGPQANLIGTDGESILDNSTGEIATTVKALLKAGAQSVVASGSDVLPALGTGGPAVVGGGLASVSGGGHLLTSGGGVISNDGGSLIGQDGSGLIGQDGSGLIGQDGSGLIGQDGSGLLTDNGGAVVSNDGGSLIGQDGSGLISSQASGAIAQTAGGNIVSSGAGNIVSSGAGNIVSSGAGN